jgi:hypothetical protein
VRGAVIHRQPAAAAAHVDADFRERDAVVINALVRVAGDEHVVGAWRDGGAQQAPLRRVQILGLVDDHMPVGRLAAVAEEPGGLVGELQERGPPRTTTGSTTASR